MSIHTDANKVHLFPLPNRTRKALRSSYLTYYILVYPRLYSLIIESLDESTSDVCAS